ncbi:MAG: GIY-YIG nuclease family protein [Rhodospirillales bacterium]|nr:GIY-YIG nuclease family protein [Rhodospirillales bacterium]MDE0381828.1 GIY-YIG nuclease family protein [Rhodospirillales bacterium]
MPDPFTIRIFVPDGDPEGVRLIDRMNWTGIGVVFPRLKWPEIKKRSEFSRTGVYILVGDLGENDDLRTLYIGQADEIGNRIDSHYKHKDFWDWGVVFVSTSGGLNRAHATWLEYALVNRANSTKRCRLDNSNAPSEPPLTEAEKADTQSFLKEILQVLPLVGLRSFEFARAVVTPGTTSGEAPSKVSSHKLDTVVVPAKKDGFEKVFLGEDCWYSIRISGGMLDKIKFIAGYQSHPISAITHYARVDRIEPYGESGKYRLVFSEKAQSIQPIPYGDAPSGAMQGPRYTSFEKLKSAKRLTDLL